MPIIKRKRGSRTCFKVKNTTTKKCLTKKQAVRQQRAIKASQSRKNTRTKTK